MEIILLVLVVILALLSIIMVWIGSSLDRISKLIETCSFSGEKSNINEQDIKLMARHLRSVEDRTNKLEKDTYSINYKVENLSKELKSQSPFTYRK